MGVKRQARCMRLPPPLTPPLKGEGNLAKLAHRAAVLAKADLQTEVVGEFPELQGQMGRKYAELQGEHASVCAAMEDHYKPQGPTDRVPTDPVAIAVALADKLDTLVGFWAIDEKPTGSKDPFALRRAALGVIRILLSLKDPVSLRALLEVHFPRITKNTYSVDADKIDNLCLFFEDRLGVQLKDLGASTDKLDAVLDLAGIIQGNAPLTIARRVEALSAYLNTEEGQNLVAGTKRAVNILNAEEKKGTVIDTTIDARLFKEPVEIALFEAMNIATNKAGEALQVEDFAGAMMALSTLRGPIDAFLDGVLVNDPDAAVKANRLALLAEIKKATQRVADFSKISG